MKIKQKRINNQSKKISLSFSDEKLTNYAGLVPFARFMNSKLQLKKVFSDNLGIDLGNNAKYSVYDYITMFIVGILAGGEHRNQVTMIMNDDILKKAFNLESVPHESTTGRLLEKVTMKHCNEMQSRVSVFRNKVWNEIDNDNITLDFDSSVETVYGNQEGAAKGYNTKKRGKKSYHPMISFISNTKEVLLAHLRSGDSYTSNGIIGFTKEAVEYLPDRVKKIFIRCDSGFFNGDFLDYLEEECSLEAKYLIKVKFKGLKKLLEKQEYTKVNDEISAATFNHKCGNWKKHRIFHAIRIQKDVIVIHNELFGDSIVPVYDYFCFVTNLDVDAMQAYHLYKQRSTSENWIEELKNQYSGCHILTKHFWANDFLLKLSCLAQNIKTWFTFLTDSTSWCEEMKTFRFWFIKNAGRLIKTGRKLILKLQKNYYLQNRFMKILNRIEKMEFG